jgi:20S proteasome alpha/beta subunit
VVGTREASLTAIVGVEYNGHVFLGGDRYCTYGEHCYTLSDPKVCRIGPLVIGSAGDLAWIQRLHLHLASLFKEQTPRTLPELMGVFWEHQKEAKESDTQHLVGFQGQLFEVDSDGACLKQKALAVGSGRGVASATLHLNAHLLPVPRLRLALETASQLCTGVGPPFDFICL